MKPERDAFCERLAIRHRRINQLREFVDIAYTIVKVILAPFRLAAKIMEVTVYVAVVTLRGILRGFVIFLVLAAFSMLVFGLVRAIFHPLFV